MSVGSSGSRGCICRTIGRGIRRTPGFDGPLWSSNSLIIKIIITSTKQGKREDRLDEGLRLRRRHSWDRI